MNYFVSKKLLTLSVGVYTLLIFLMLTLQIVVFGLGMVGLVNNFWGIFALKAIGVLTLFIYILLLIAHFRKFKDREHEMTGKDIFITMISLIFASLILEISVGALLGK